MIADQVRRINPVHPTPFICIDTVGFFARFHQRAFFWLARHGMVEPQFAIEPAMFPLLSTLFVTTQFQKQRYACAIALYLLILILGSIPGARAEVGEYASGMVLHSMAYAVLTFLLFSGSNGTPFQRGAKALLTVMAMGALDEIVQSFLPYRHGAVSDWLVDCNAALLTSLILWAIWPKAILAPHR